MVGDRLLDFVDGDAALGSAAQGRAEQGLGLVNAERRQAGAGDGGQGVHGAFELAHRAGGAVDQMFEHLGLGLARDDAETGQGLDAAAGHGQLQGAVGGLDRAGQAGGQMAAQARLDLGQGHGRAVGGEDDLLAVLDQGGEGREQFFLGAGLAADELDVVDQQHVGVAQTVLERRHGPVLGGADEGRQKAFGGQIDDPGVRPEALCLPGDGVEQVGLAVAIGAAEEDRVEMTVGPGGGLAGNSQGEGIALPFHETVEGQPLLQAGGAHGAGTVGDGRHGGHRHGCGLQRDDGGALGAAGGDLGGRGGRTHLGAATDVEATRQAVEAQPQLIHAAQGVLAHPVAGIGGRGDEDQLAGTVGAHGRGGDIGAEGPLADLAAQAARRLGPDTIRIRHPRHLRAPRHRHSHPWKPITRRPSGEA